MQTKIIVLIAHYNNPAGLLQSLKSIRESFSVDICIVDDGSDEKFDETTLRKAYTNGQLFFLYLEKNSGIVAALNKGLVAIEKWGYTHIARLDCGDLFHPNKLAKQLTYLQKNPTVKLLGTWVNFVDEQYHPFYVLKHPITHTEIKKKMYLNSMFVHPSVVFKTEILKKVGLYPSNYPHAEDYAFFFNIMKQYKVENYPEVLLDYVVEENSISTKNRFKQVKSRLKVIFTHFYWGFYPLYGLCRNFILLFMSRKFAQKLKKLLLKK